MRKVEQVAIEVFVAQALYSKEISKLTENWNIEIAFIRNVVVNYFKGLGIEHVRPNEESDYGLNLVKTILKASPELKNKLAEVQRAAEEALLKKKRNA